MVLGSITDENNGNAGAGSDLIPPAPQPNLGALNMESDEAAKLFIFCCLKKKTGICVKQWRGCVVKWTCDSTTSPLVKPVFRTNLTAETNIMLLEFHLNYESMVYIIIIASPWEIPSWFLHLEPAVGLYCLLLSWSWTGTHPVHVTVLYSNHQTIIT